MDRSPDTYTHGHAEPVITHHAARTAGNSASYLLPHLRTGTTLLDVGCGPGSITVDLARQVDPGRVVGIDPVEEVLEVARSAAVESGVGNVEFVKGSAYDLDFADDEFDVVHAHQVLQHLTDPVAALVEMRRVARQVVGVRDADYAGMVWAPSHPMLDRWMELYHQVTSHNDADADAGRHLLGWMHAAGFRDVTVSSSTWTYADAESRAWWGDGWARRALESDFAHQAVAAGLSERAELEAISSAWSWWAQQTDGCFVVLHLEAVGIA